MSSLGNKDVPNQQLSVRWNNYLKRVTNAFDSLLTQGDLIDVTLSCEGKKIKAHQMLLSACSSYFKEIFKENPCRHPVIIFRNVKYEDLSAIIYFIYHGEVNVTQEQLASFLITAEMLQIQGLTDNFDDDDNVEDQQKRVHPVEVSDVEIVSDSKRQKIVIHDDIVSDDKTIVAAHLSDAGGKLDAVEKPGNSSSRMETISVPEASKPANISHLKPDDQFVVEETVANEDRNLDKGTSASTDRDIAPADKVQSGGLVKFRCHVCWKGFKHPTSLTLHKDAHTGKTQCPVCRRSFSRSYDMRNHLQRIHQDQQSAAD